MPRTMRAVAKDARGACGIVEAPVPEPGRGEVLIRVRAASVNHGDWASGAPLHRGEFGGRRNVMCSDVAGTVEGCGPGVTGLKPGDEVCGVSLGLKGALAEYAVAKESWCARKPRAMSWEFAAAVPSAGVTALAAVEKAAGGGVSTGSDVSAGAGARDALVVGASGGVGQFALTLACRLGCAVDAVCGSRGTADAERLGARHAYDYRQGLSAVHGTYDCVLAVNGAYPASDYLRLIKPGGSLVLVGFDSLKPSMLTVPAKGVKLRAALFFSAIGKGGLQKACDLLAAGGEMPNLEVVGGLDAGVERLTTLAENHPRGKLVIKVA